MTDSIAPDDRRRYPRSPLSLLVQHRSSSFEEFLTEHATNISIGGMFIATRAPQELGALVYLQFTLEDGEKLIEGLGRVVRVSPPESGSPGIGVEFVNFDEESMALIEEICQRRLEKQPAGPP
ncbi:MAG: TIGR02266 family protein [Myxococcaceae bacterium]